MTLTLWRDLTPLAEPMRRPTIVSPHILVIGGGVTGLVTSWALLDRGYSVTILSSAWVNEESRLTSQIAGALWEFPPAVCGSHTDAISLAHSKRWCMTAYRVWDAIASIPILSEESGVRMMPSDFFFPDIVENDDAQYSKMVEIIASGVRGFYRGADLMDERRVDESYGAVDAYELMAPIIDTDKAMEWLTRLVQDKGAQLVTETINDDLLNVEGKLRTRFGADVIINCTGLQGQVLAGDSTVYPIRGGLIRVINDGSDFPKVEAALTITADAVHDSNEIVFLVPRNDNILLIGGIAEPHEWDLNLTLDSPIIRRMRERCEAFLPDLKAARVDPDYPLAQGLRPFRGNNVRVERELRRPNSRIVHSYGQGGAGWSLSFGCAHDVLLLVEEVLTGVAARSMREMESERKGMKFRGTREARAAL
ncbi:nucleotide-binding domain-containing protein [Truncatella angustata]|uniref:Nucleotide-binding domain-containing protein n=1 Tax=Truncatella angustata TaxID=152316 RepID=A0A9P8RHD5_9PEZI|nr:nucleotide-binding domain-containing protein [Truncatella angustata]KAH6645882.1 nucleotide-binding domain-containing protein [Truncatella angustata]